MNRLLQKCAFRVVLWAIPLSMWFSCGAPSVQRRPEARRVEHIRTLVEENGAREVFLARFNPTVCTCPSFEILLGKSWVRVELVGQTEDEEGVRAMKRSAQNAHQEKPSQTYRIKGEPDATRIGVCGLSFPVLDFEFQGEDSGTGDEPRTPELKDSPSK